MIGASINICYKILGPRNRDHPGIVPLAKLTAHAHKVTTWSDILARYEWRCKYSLFSAHFRMGLGVLEASKSEKVPGIAQSYEEGQRILLKAF